MQRKKVLNKRQQLWVLAFLTSFNASEAAREAGYSKRTAAQMGYENLRKPEIQHALALEMEERMTRAKFTAQQVLQEHIDIMNMDIKDILNNDFTFKPLDFWPPIWRRNASILDVKKLISGKGEDSQTIGVQIKIRGPEKLKNLELLGKHIAVNAYKKPEQDQDSTDTLKEFIRELSGRSIGPPSLRKKKFH